MLETVEAARVCYTCWCCWSLLGCWGLPGCGWECWHAVGLLRLVELDGLCGWGLLCLLGLLWSAEIAGVCLVLVGLLMLVGFAGVS